MEKKIKQARFSNSVIFFKKDFLKLYSLQEYNNKNEPCVFVGVYNQQDVDVINGHQAPKIIINTGEIRDCFFNINSNNVFVRNSNSEDKKIEKLILKYKTKNCRFPLKDFSLFQPTPLGDKIYYYAGQRWNFDSRVEEIQKKINFEILIGYMKYTIEDLKINFYDKCFLNLKLHLIGGFTTATELAYMGRKTISNAKAPFCIPYTNIDGIVDIINKESKKINTIQPPCVDGWFDTGNEWLNVDFWR